MKEPSSVEMIRDYATSRGYEFSTNAEYERHGLYPGDPVLNTKYCVFKVHAGNINLYLCQHDYYSTHAGMNNTWCGLFRTNERREEFVITVKSWLDAVTLHKHRKTGSDFMDENLIVNSPESLPGKYVNRKLAEELVSLSKIITPVKIISTESYVNYVPELAAGHILGIVTDKWLTDEKELDVFIEKGTMILTAR
jgi:hypothetical protein